MSPVSYSFNANKPKYRSKDRGGSKRRILIFITLFISFGVLIYIFFADDDKKNTEKGKKGFVNLAPPPKEVKETPTLVVDTKTAQNKLEQEKADKPKAEKVDPPVKKYIPKSFPKMETLLNKAQAAYKQGHFDQARKMCYQILESRTVPDEDPLWDKTAKLLGEANVKILFTDYPFPEKKVNYHVEPNDGLRKIATVHNTSMETVQRSNNMKLTDINVQLGQTYNIYKGQWKIVISISRKKLYLFDGSKLFKVYGVGTGRQNRTPTGAFKTSGKEKNPDWYSPKGKIPFGEKGNVLGTRWIRLKPTGKVSRKVSGLGIHGTWEPESIGKAKSNGCIRMLNKDVEELFAILPNETKPVSVRIIK